jgi:hypothetical protein
MKVVIRNQHPMSRSAILKGALVGATLFASGMAILDCTDRDPKTNDGSVKLDLRVSSTAKIDTISYLVSGNDISPLTGQIDVSKSMTATATVRGIPAGKKYQVQLDASTSDGLVTCAGSSDVDVTAGKTAAVTINMQCTDTRNTGTVSINGTFDNCPGVTAAAAMPVTAAVDGVINLQATGVDLDGDGLTFRWRQSTDVGTLGAVAMTSTRAATSTFTCKAVGMTTLTVTASDGTCEDSASIPITCTSEAGGGSGSGGGNATGGSGSGNTPGGGTGTGGTPGTGNATGSGSGGSGEVTGTATGGAGGMLGAGMGGMMTGQGGAMASSIGGTGYGGNGSCLPSHCAGEDCDLCSFGPTDSPKCATFENGCNNAEDSLRGCDGFSDPKDKKACEDLIACTMSAGCLTPGNQGDLIPCWCGTNPTTCVSANDGPTKANGPCLAQVTAAARLTPDTYDASTIRQRQKDSAFPLARASILLNDRGMYCNKECGIP